VVLTGGPHPSAAREKEGEGRGAGWARSKKEARGAVFWAKMAERKRGKSEKLFLFIFQTKFSNSFPNEFLI